ncbi:MAG: MFS transporter [bacterium]
MNPKDTQAKKQPHPLALLYPTQLFAGAMLISLGPLLDPILRDLHIPLAEGGILSLGFFLGRVLGVLLLNFGLARVRLKSILVGAAWVQAAALIVAGLLAPGLWPLFGALLVAGLAAVIPNAISGVWVGAHVRTGTERAMLLILAFFALGVVAAPLAIGAALSLGGTWRWVFVGEAAFSAIMAMALTTSRLPDVKGRENLRLRQLREMAGFAPRLLAVMLVAIFIYVGSETVLGVWLAKFEIDVHGASPSLAAISVTLLWTGITLGRYLTVPLTRWVRPSRLLVVFAAVQTVFILGTVLSPTLVASLACVFLAGLGASVCFPLIGGYTSRFPGWYAGVAFSGMMLAGTLGSTVFSYLIGPVAEALSLRLAIGLTAVLPGLVIILALALDRVSGERASSRV